MTAVYTASQEWYASRIPTTTIIKESQITHYIGAEYMWILLYQLDLGSGTHFGDKIHIIFHTTNLILFSIINEHTEYTETIHYE